jgi:predicted patatin/cPLA2 family phospholipase
MCKSLDTYLLSQYGKLKAAFHYDAERIFKMDQIGLVLQGGGMRGVYTSGVLDFFMEQQLYFPYVVGVSAGACNAACYLSRQKGLGKIMHIDFLHDPKYISFRNLIRNKSLFGMDFIFDEIPKELFNFQSFHEAKEQLVVATTDCEHGEGLYFDKKDCEQIFTVIRASCSLPFVTKMVHYQGFKLLDGGITVPIPIQKSLDDGNHRNVIIQTSEHNTRAKPFNLKWLAHSVYPRYKNLAKAIINHHQIYSDTLYQIKALEASNKVFIFRNSNPIKTGAIERDPRKLVQLYDQGYQDARLQFDKLLHWIEFDEG